MVKLFVYGTLRTPPGPVPADTQNYDAISNEVLSAEPATLARAQMLSYIHYPGIAPGGGIVVGDLFELTNAGLEICDGIEAHPEFYRRSEVEVSTANGDLVVAWTYWAPDAMITTGVPIPSGDWFERDRSDNDGRTFGEALAADKARF